MFPSAFKKAKVIRICKSGNSANPLNYRPISVLSVLSRPTEKHVNKHLLLHLNRHNLLHPNQSGFRKTHSSVVDQWLTDIDNNEFNGVIFVVLYSQNFKKLLMLLIMTCFCESYLLWNVGQCFGILSIVSHQQTKMCYCWY